MVLLLFFALLLGAPFMLFNSGSSVPDSGQGEPVAPLTPPSTKSGGARIALKSLRPLVVVGSGFKPHETVRIGGVASRTVAADRAGSFTARFRGVDPCGSITLTAVGSRGSRASFNFSALACP
ncbi:MAG: hypothetical protein M3310_05000 [Actinomycetota bacterium]|nr:hypothetical protein [Actinomycetota bacterium]